MSEYPYLDYVSSIQKSKNHVLKIQMVDFYTSLITERRTSWKELWAWIYKHLQK